MGMIHYHGTPFGGGIDNSIRPLIAKHAMVSFAEPSQVTSCAEMCQSFCFDNGAFSAWKSGKPLNIDGYAEFVDKWLRHPSFDFYVIPDVIDGSAPDNVAMIAKWRSMCGHDMLRHGAPVWHMHEPLTVLANMCNAYYRVCIGSSGQYAVVGDNKWWARMADAMSVACDDRGRPKTKLHGLRMLDPTVFSRIPLSSADSTNVARNMGIDSAWKQAYSPASQSTRAIIMMERIEAHASAKNWNAQAAGVQSNLELFG